MNKNKHLILEERNIIEQRLNERESFKGIARELLRDPTTIAKEVKTHIQFRQTGCYGKSFNNCMIRKDCTSRHLCGNRKCNRYCRFCNTHLCSSLCPDYHQEMCKRLSKPPTSAMAVETENPFQSGQKVSHRSFLSVFP